MGLEINEEEGIFKVGCFSKIFLRRKVFKGIFNENDEKGDNNENDDCNDSILRVLFFQEEGFLKECFRRKDFQWWSRSCWKETSLQLKSSLTGDHFLGGDQIFAFFPIWFFRRLSTISHFLQWDFYGVTNHLPFLMCYGFTKYLPFFSCNKFVENLRLFQRECCWWFWDFYNSPKKLIFRMSGCVMEILALHRMTKIDFPQDFWIHLMNL